jgi:NADPH:quinone reductase-like Zn-dependent oxidoreductase
MALPQHMRAVVLHHYRDGHHHLTIEQRALTPPGPHDVVVRIAAAAVHPADLVFVQGRYGVRKPLPTVPGFEGMGEVVQVGAAVDRSWLGRRVACMSAEHDGTWAEYLTTPHINVLPIPDDLPEALAAMLFVNPLTAWALHDIARQAGATSLIQTAAASALGRMLIRLCARSGIESINIIRRDEHIAGLQDAGARYILNSTEPTFEKHLRALTRSMHTSIAFDAVGGRLSGQILRALHTGGTLCLYGSLAAEPVEISIDQIIFRSKHIRGFWLSLWMRENGPETRAQALADILAQRQDYTPAIAGRYPLERAHDALDAYAADMTRGKVLLVPRIS